MQNRSNFRDKIPDVLELPVDAGKANVSNMIDVDQFLHDQLTDSIAFNFLVTQQIDFLKDIANHPLNTLSWDRSFPTGPLQSTPKRRTPTAR